MLRCLFALLLVQVALGSVPRKYLRDDDDLSGVDPDILDGLDDYDEEAERIKQELIDQYARGVSRFFSSLSLSLQYSLAICFKPVFGLKENMPVWCLIPLI